MILHYVALFYVTVQHVIGHGFILKQVFGVALRATRYTSEHAKDAVIKWNNIITAREKHWNGSSHVTVTRGQLKPL